MKSPRKEISVGTLSHSSRPKQKTANTLLALPLQATLQLLPLDHVLPRASQARKHFDLTSLTELTDSIKRDGILQPIIVRSVAVPADTSGPENVAENDLVLVDTRYEIIAGERRWRAAREAGLLDIPVLVQTLDDARAAEISLVENLQRADLAPLEIGDALAQLIDNGYSIRKLAAHLNKQKGWLEEHLRLARLPEDLRAMVSGRPDTMTHARELAKVDAALRAELIQKVEDKKDPLSLAKLRQLLPKSAAGKEVEEVLADEDIVAGCAEGAGEDTPAATPDAEHYAENSETAEAAQTPENTPLEMGDLSNGAALNDDSANSVSAEMQLHEEKILRTLKAAQKILVQLPPPPDMARREQLMQTLKDMGDAIAETLARWGV